MATRKELMIAHDLLTKIARMNDNVWVAANIMQDKHPYTGEKLQIRLEENPPRDATFDELQSISGGSIAYIDEIRSQVNSFLVKINPGSMQQGLAYYKKNVAAINGDLGKITAARSQFATDLPAAADKADLAARGLAIASAYQPEIEGRFTMPRKMQSLNIAHDVLDALSFELQQKSSYTGDPQSYSLEVLKTLISKRCAVALDNGAGQDPELEPVAGYLLANVGAANDLAAMAALGAYIDANLEKLPLIRRHWAL